MNYRELVHSVAEEINDCFDSGDSKRMIVLSSILQELTLATQYTGKAIVDRLDGFIDDAKREESLAAASIRFAKRFAQGNQEK